MEVMVMANKWDVDEWVEGRVNTAIKSFYPTIVAKDTELPLRFVFERLLEMSEDEKLVLKWEVRCPECHETIDYCDVFPIIQDGTTIFCERDQEDFELEIENIYPVFEFSPDYREFLRDRENRTQKKKPLRRTSSKRDTQILVPQP